jgi:hypothetical protein
LPIFNNNYTNSNIIDINKKNETSSISENDKKYYTHSLEPTQPTLPTLSKEESSILHCPVCDYTGIEVDIGVHIFEKHRYYLKQLERDSLDLNIRTNFIIEKIKAKIIQ